MFSHIMVGANDIDGRFGPGFAAELDGLQLGAWSGPVESVESVVPASSAPR